MGYYSDCWTYPKEEIDELLEKAKAETYTKEQVDELIPKVEEKTGSITIGDTLICWGTHNFESVATAGANVDVTLQGEYADTDYAAIAVNSYYYDSYCDIVASQKTGKAITLWARAVSSTQTNVAVSWVTIGKKKTAAKKRSK